MNKKGYGTIGAIFFVLFVLVVILASTNFMKFGSLSIAPGQTYDGFILYGNSGSWEVHFQEYAIGTTPPIQTPPGGTADNSIQVNLASIGASGEELALEIVSQLALTGYGTGVDASDGNTIPGGSAQSGAWFSDDFEFSYIGDVITIKDRFLGSRTNASAGTSPFSVGTAQNGSSTARTISLASDSTLGSKALVCVFPS